jgi:hypothetical protein
MAAATEPAPVEPRVSAGITPFESRERLDGPVAGVTAHRGGQFAIGPPAAATCAAVSYVGDDRGISRPARYTLVVAATNAAGQHSPPSALTLTIVK